MLDNIVRAMQYSRLVASMKKMPSDVKKDLGLTSNHEITKRAKQLIYNSY